MPLDDWTRDVATGAVGAPWKVVRNLNFPWLARHPDYCQPAGNGGDYRMIRMDESLNPWAYPLALGISTFGAFLPDPFYRDQRFDNKDEGDLFTSAATIGGRAATVVDSWRRSGPISQGRVLPANRVLSLYQTVSVPRYLPSTDPSVDLTDAYETRSVELRIAKATSVSWLMLWMPLSGGAFALTGVCLRARPIVPVIPASALPPYGIAFDPGVPSLAKLEVLTIVDGSETSRGSLVLASRGCYVDAALCRSSKSLSAPDQVVVSVASGGTMSSLRFPHEITDPDATICGGLAPAGDPLGYTPWVVQAVNDNPAGSLTRPVDHGELVHVAHFGGAAATVPYPNDTSQWINVSGLPRSSEWATYAASQYPYALHAGHLATLEGVQLRPFADVATTPVYNLREYDPYTDFYGRRVNGTAERYPVREVHAVSAMLQPTAVSVVHGRTQTADAVLADDSDAAFRLGQKRITGVTLTFTPYEEADGSHLTPTLGDPVGGYGEPYTGASGGAAWLQDGGNYTGNNGPIWLSTSDDWWVNPRLMFAHQIASPIAAGAVSDATFREILYGQLTISRSSFDGGRLVNYLGGPGAFNDLSGLGITQFPTLPPGDLRGEFSFTRCAGDANHVFSCTGSRDLSRTLQYNRHLLLRTQLKTSRVYSAVAVPFTEAWQLTCNLDMRCTLGVALQEYGTFTPGSGENAVYDAHVEHDRPKGRFRDTIAYVDGKAPRAALSLTLSVRLPLSGTLDLTIDTTGLPGNYPFRLDAFRTRFVAQGSGTSGVSDWAHQFSADETAALLSGGAVDLKTWQTYGETDKYHYLDCGGVGRRYRVRCSLTTTAVVD